MERNSCPCSVCGFRVPDGSRSSRTKREFSQVTNVTAIRLSLENSPRGEALSVEERIKNDERKQGKVKDSGNVIHQRDDVNSKSGFQFDLKRLSTKNRDVRINDDCLKTTEDV